MAAIEPWKECLQWLVQCRVLEPQLQGDSLEVLAGLLRDGVLLCNLLNVLEPQCIDVALINHNPQMMRILCLCNISMFLETCEGVFNIEESDLFKPAMLLDVEDMLQVLHTLSALSLCPKAVRSAIKGFHFQNVCNTCQGDIYKTLSVIDFQKLSSNRLHMEIHDLYLSSHYEEFYNKLCTGDKTSEQAEGCAMPCTKEKREYILEEILHSEEKYVRLLNDVREQFIGPLSKVLSTEDSDAIFGNIMALAGLHDELFAQLKDSVTLNASKPLSDVFLSHWEQFLIYGEYCANLPNAQTLLLEKCTQNIHVKMEVGKCEKMFKDGKSYLQDVLVLPMQRVLKYHLLLERLVGDTQPNHEEYKGLEKAKDAMKDVSEYINAVRRDKEKLETVQKIEERIEDIKMPEDTHLKDYGICHKDDELLIKFDGQQKGNRYVFLFDRVLLICRLLKNNLLSYERSLDLSEYKIKDCLPSAGKDSRFQWYLIPKTNKEYTLAAKTTEQKKKWMTVIVEVLDNIAPADCCKSDHGFVMSTFNAPTMCDTCRTSLKGLVYQGYKCTKCDMSVHKHCIAKSGYCFLRHVFVRELPPLPPPQGDDADALMSAPQEAPSTPCADTVRWSKYSALGHFPWFVGEIEREEASNLLQSCPIGTFLLRIRPQRRVNMNEPEYAFGMKTSQGVKHMRVNEVTEMGHRRYYLSRARYFDTIELLVDYYEHASLQENFEGLDEKFALPFHKPVTLPFEEDTSVCASSDVQDKAVTLEDEDYGECEEVAAYRMVGRAASKDLDWLKDNVSVWESYTTVTLDKEDNDTTVADTELGDLHIDAVLDPKEDDVVVTPSSSSSPNTTLSPAPSSSSSSSTTSAPAAPKEEAVMKKSCSVEAINMQKMKVSRITRPQPWPRKDEYPYVDGNVRRPGMAKSLSVSLKEESDQGISVCGKHLSGSYVQLTTKGKLSCSLGSSSSKTAREIPARNRNIGTNKGGPKGGVPAGTAKEEETKGRNVTNVRGIGTRSKSTSMTTTTKQDVRLATHKLEDVHRLQVMRRDHTRVIDARNRPASAMTPAKTYTGSTSSYPRPATTTATSKRLPLVVVTKATATQTSSCDAPSSHDHIQVFGQFIVSELRTIRNKDILLSVKRTIQNVVIDAIENDHAIQY